MSYPEELLPKNGYKVINCDLSNFFLIRIIFKKGDLIDPEVGTIRLEYLFSPKERIIDLSFSLLGIYKPEHIFIKFTESGQKFNAYCDSIKNGDVPKITEDFIIDEDRCYWTILIKDIDAFPFTFKHKDEDFTAICKVAHTPTLGNYWHFSLHWEINENIIKDPNDLNKKEAQKLGHAVRTYFKEKITLTPVDDYPIIEESCFLGN